MLQRTEGSQPVDAAATAEAAPPGKGAATAQVPAPDVPPGGPNDVTAPADAALPALSPYHHGDNDDHMMEDSHMQQV